MGSRFELKRLLFKGVKSVALLGFYAAPEAWAAIGYPTAPGPPGPRIQDAMDDPAPDQISPRARGAG